VTDKEEDNHEIGIDCIADERCKKKNRGSQMADENTELHAHHCKHIHLDSWNCSRERPLSIPSGPDAGDHLTSTPALLP